VNRPQIITFRIAGLAQEAQSAAMERTPSSGDWGFCDSDDSPPPFNSAWSGFLWFADKEGLLSYFREHAAVLRIPNGDHDEEDAEETANFDAIVALAVDKAAQSGDVEPVRLEINRIWSGTSELRWVGPFDELTRGETTFALALRREFRDDGESDQGDPNGDVIDADEMDNGRLRRILGRLRRLIRSVAALGRAVRSSADRGLRNGGAGSPRRRIPGRRRRSQFNTLHLEGRRAGLRPPERLSPAQTRHSRFSHNGRCNVVSGLSRLSPTLPVAIIASFSRNAKSGRLLLVSTTPAPEPAPMMASPPRRLQMPNRRYVQVT
jgi:hypothetical protein